MKTITSEYLIEAIIDEIIDYGKKIGHKEITNMQNTKNYSKIDLSIFLIKNEKIDIYFKYYQNYLISFLNKIKSQSDEIKLFNHISNDDCFLAYGLLCGVYCMFKDENEAIFENFNIEKFPRILEVIKEYTNIKNLKNIYLEKLESFTNEFIDYRNIDNKFQIWFKVLYEKDLSSIPFVEKRKKIEEKKKFNSISVENKEEKIPITNKKNKIKNLVNDNININHINYYLNDEKQQHINNKISKKYIKYKNAKKNDNTFINENKPQNNNNNNF